MKKGVLTHCPISRKEEKRREPKRRKNGKQKINGGKSRLDTTTNVKKSCSLCALVRSASFCMYLLIFIILTIPFCSMGNCRCWMCAHWKIGRKWQGYIQFGFSSVDIKMLFLRIHRIQYGLLFGSIEHISHWSNWFG